MEPLARSMVSPSLNKLSEIAMMRHVFDPSPSLSTILAFMILSLWSPLQGSSPVPAKVHDNRLIAAAAVNMCNSLRLDQAAVEVFNIASRKRSGENISTTDMATVDALREKALIVSSLFRWMIFAYLLWHLVVFITYRRVYVRLISVFGIVTDVDFSLKRLSWNRSCRLLEITRASANDKGALPLFNCPYLSEIPTCFIEAAL